MAGLRVTMPASLLGGSYRMAGRTRLVVMSPTPMTSQGSMRIHDNRVRQLPERFGRLRGFDIAPCTRAMLMGRGTQYG